MSKREPKTPKAPRINKTEAFVMELVHRSTIKEHPKNPRTITPQNQKKLRQGIEKFGVLKPITVSKRTGYILGGHQTLDQADAVEGTKDYKLNVAMVDVTPKEELKIIVLLNNAEAQGEYDLSKLLSVMEEIPSDEIEDTGFDQVGLEVLLGEEGRGLFSGDEETEEAKDAVADMEAAEEAKKKEAEEAKERRQKMRVTAAEEQAENDTERFAVVVFPTRAARDKWVELIGLEAGTRYVPCAAVLALKKGEGETSKKPPKTQRKAPT